MRKLISFLFAVLIAFGSMGIPVALHACRSEQLLSTTIGFESDSCCDEHETVDVRDIESNSFKQNGCCADSFSYYKCHFAPSKKVHLASVFLFNNKIDFRFLITEINSEEKTTEFQLETPTPPLLRRLALKRSWLI